MSILAALRLSLQRLRNRRADMLRSVEAAEHPDQLRATEAEIADVEEAVDDIEEQQARRERRQRANRMMLAWCGWPGELWP